MRKVLIVLVVLSLLLSGCGPSGQLFKEPVTFYYVLEEYEYGGSASVIAAEERESAGHRRDLSYLMALYMVGPSEEGLVSPLPRDARIFGVKEADGAVTLKLSDTTDIMTEAEFTQACACLTLTCLGLTNAETVTIHSGERTVTMTRENMILYDGSHLSAMEEAK